MEISRRECVGQESGAGCAGNAPAVGKGQRSSRDGPNNGMAPRRRSPNLYPLVLECSSPQRMDRPRVSRLADGAAESFELSGD